MSAPKNRDIIASQLRSEGRELLALAEMVEDMDVKTVSELRREYIPRRVESLQNVGHPVILERTKQQWKQKEEVGVTWRKEPETLQSYKILTVRTSTSSIS